MNACQEIQNTQGRNYNVNLITFPVAHMPDSNQFPNLVFQHCFRLSNTFC